MAEPIVEDLMPRRSFLLLLLLMIPLISLGCASNGLQREKDVETLHVFAAASLTQAFSEISTSFTAAYPGTEVILNFSGSNQLATQIGHGAPADIFASANERQMAVAIEAGRAISNTQYIFAYNKLVVVMPSDNPARLSRLSDLNMLGLKVVLAAPEVPVGNYTTIFLEKAVAAGLLNKANILQNVVSYETNVRAVLSKVVLGEADAGIVYASDIANQQGDIQQLEIPEHLNILASYPLAPLVDNANPVLAQQFIDYVLGSEGQRILTAYGFLSNNGNY